MELKEKKSCVVEGNPSGKKTLLNTPAYLFSLFGLQVVLFLKRKKNSIYHLWIQLFLYVSNLTEQLSAGYTSK